MSLPTIALSHGGSGGTARIDGTDLCGSVTVIVGSGAGPNVDITLTFASPINPPNEIGAFFYPVSTDAVALGGGFTPGRGGDDTLTASLPSSAATYVWAYKAL